jgi:hypothetical protein
MVTETSLLDPEEVRNVSSNDTNFYREFDLEDTPSPNSKNNCPRPMEEKNLFLKLCSGYCSLERSPPKPKLNTLLKISELELTFLLGSINCYFLSPRKCIL